MKNSSNTFRNVAIILVVLAVGAAGAWWHFQNSFADEAYETFQTAMNSIVSGPSKWEAGAHDFSLANRTLTVNQLKITVVPETPKPEQATSEGEPSATSATPPAPSKPQVINIDKVTIKNGLRLAQLKRLLGLTDWRAQSETLIAEDLTLSKIGLNIDAVDAKGFINLDTFNVTDVKLLASSKDQTAGPLGFIQSFSVGKILVNETKLSISSLKEKIEQDKIDLSFGPVNIVAPRLAEGLTTIEDPLLIFKLFTSLSCQDFRVQNFNVAGQFPSEKAKFSFKVADVREQGVVANGRVDKFYLNGLDFFVDSPEVQSDVKLGSLIFNGLDYTALLKRSSQVLERLAARTILEPTRAISSGEIMELYGSFYTLANLFSLPYDLTDFTVTDFHATINKGFKVGIAKSVITGPFKSGRVPPRNSAEISGYINLPTVDNPEDKLTTNAYKFGKEFGQTEFKLNYVSALTYDPASGAFKTNKNELKVDDLFTLSGETSLVNLTETFVAALDNISFNDPMAVMAVPGLMDVGVSSLSFTLIDQSLFDKILRIIAAESERPIEEVRQNVKPLLRAWANEFLMAKGVTNVGDVVQALELLIDNPHSLTVGANPDPPFSGNSFIALKGDQAAVLNSLNIYLSANEQKPISLNWLKLTDLTPAEPMFQEDTLSSN